MVLIQLGRHNYQVSTELLQQQVQVEQVELLQQVAQVRVVM
jgi:hypothetical protein